MKGNQNVLEQLHKLLRNELAARDQYFTHSRMYLDWGLTKLYERINHEMQDETGHASRLIERILFLESTPDLSQQDGLNIGKTVPEMLQNDLDYEYKVMGISRGRSPFVRQNKITKPVISSGRCWPTPRKTMPTG